MSRAGSSSGPRPGNSKARLSWPRPRSVSSGRSPGFRIIRRGLLPGRATGVGRSLASSGLPPEASPVTVAGAARDFHPLPFAERFKEPRRGRTITRPTWARNLCIECKKCAVPTTRSTSTASAGSDSPRSCSPRASPPRRSSRSAGSSRGRTTCSSRASLRKPGTRCRSRPCRAAPTTTRAPRRSISRSASRCRASKASWQSSPPEPRTCRSPKKPAARSNTWESRRRSCRTSESRASCACSRASRRSSART